MKWYPDRHELMFIKLLMQQDTGVRNRMQALYRVEFSGPKLNLIDVPNPGCQILHATNARMK